MFFNILQRVCNEKGISISALLDEIGMSRGNMARWKEGLDPKASTKKKIAEALGVNLSVFEKEQPALSKEDELQDEFFAFYGEVKPYLDERDIDDLKIFMKAKAEHKRKMQDDKG